MSGHEHLISPYGGKLVNLIADSKRCKELRLASREWVSWDLSPQQLCNLELLMNGGYSPLDRFMDRTEYESVCSSMHLTNGLLWPMPITLDIPEELAKRLKREEPVALRDSEGVILAVLYVDEIWRWDHAWDGERILGASDRLRARASDALKETNPFCVSGRLEGLQSPTHYDYPALRFSPSEMRAEFLRMGWRRIVAFQTQNPMHRAQVEFTLRTVKQFRANLLLHPSVGTIKPSDVDYHSRVRCYQALLSHYPTSTVRLALLPLAVRGTGLRETIQHAIIRRNFGCTHVVVDSAAKSLEVQSDGDFDDISSLGRDPSEELGIAIVPFRKMVYLEEKDVFVFSDEVPSGARTLAISDEELDQRLDEGHQIPGWFTYPEIAKQLRRAHPPRYRQGFTVFFTGLSGSGKSTVANVLLVKLLEIGGRPVTFLDGDLVRKNLSSELGFSKEHRDVNVRRIGFVAREITKNGGIAICAPIAPYDRTRAQVREQIEEVGGFVLVYVSTALEVCEQRDRKGLYAKARGGLIPAFTGVSDPYEPPVAPQLVVDTASMSPDEAAHEILLYLEKEGYIAEESAR